MIHYVALLMASFACGFENLLLIGPKRMTVPLAHHYSHYYQIPIVKSSSYLYPPRYVMVHDPDDTDTSLLTGLIKGDGDENDIPIKQIDITDYPHHDKHPNYFISWLKQRSS